MSIGGRVAPDVISQHAYSDIAALQAAAHAIEVKLSQRILEVEARLHLGATEEVGEYYYDRETRLVRTRRDDKLTGS